MPQAWADPMPALVGVSRLRFAAMSSIAENCFICNRMILDFGN
jgi:hypothetical protein